MPRAICEGVVLAEAAHCVAVGGLHYFPPDSLRTEFLRPSTTYTLCSKMGPASYFHLEVNGKRIRDAAWFYPTPREDGYGIKDYVAFGRSVHVEP
ncbi:MAG: DUF427 domain-containing protein [Acidobacteria bacterium]|nr:DUF427 domain-containing protein [Acidobacteriota bacterium]